MNKLNTLLPAVKLARQQFIKVASGLSFDQSQFKSSAEAWSVADIIEHMVWAEMGAINGVWKTLEGIKNDNPIWKGEAIHHGLPIEEIIEKTWRTKEEFPNLLNQNGVVLPDIG